MALSDFDEAVLAEIDHEPLHADALGGAFQTEPRLIERFGIGSLAKLKVSLVKLEQLGYIRPVSEFRDNELHRVGYKIAPLGRRTLTRSGGGTNYLISDSVTTIAHNSPGARQSIDIASFDIDIQEKIEELQDAIAKKDKNRIGKIFGYIADKSVDVAIALLTKGITQP